MHHRNTGNTKLIVLGGVLIALVIGSFVAASRGSGAAFSFLPFLLILACPLMMMAMMGHGGHGGHGSHTEPGTRQETTLGGAPQGDGLTSEEQVRLLRGELANLAWRQQQLRDQLERLETERAGQQVRS